MLPKLLKAEAEIKKLVPKDAAEASVPVSKSSCEKQLKENRGRINGLTITPGLMSDQIDALAADSLVKFQATMPVPEKTGANFPEGKAADLGDIVTVAKQATKYRLAFLSKSRQPSTQKAARQNIL